jgi:hypothetical protein
MKIIKYKFLAAVMLLTITSCEKVIDLDLDDDTGKLVIEGSINNKWGVQSVKLSRNVSFTQTNSYPAVSAADVTISDQTGKIYTLKETSPGLYSYSPLSGTAGSVYTLNVSSDGKTYSSSSTMPALVPLDSITAKNSLFESEQKEISVHYRDPAGNKNQYRFVLFVNGVQVKNTFAVNDNFSDGRGVNLILRAADDIKSGDTVTIEMQCIDPSVYTYWFTLSQQSSGGPGGGTAPANPPGNLSNNALGYFSAHTTQVKSIIVK